MAPKRLLQADAHKRGPFELTVMLIASGLAVINMGLGLTLVLGAPTRTAGVAFDRIKDLAPVAAWGWVFVTTGSMALVCQWLQRPALVALGHVTAGFMCLFWVGAFIVGFLGNPNVAGTGVWAYLAIAWAHLCVAATARRP